MIKLIEQILKLIYPPTCGICKKLDNNYLCKKCEKILREQAIYGIDCCTEENDKYFDEHLYIFMYGGLIRNIMLNYKFREKAYLYKTFVKILLKNQKFVEIIKTYDIIVPVPLSRTRNKLRGYNQSELIATEISKTLKLDLIKNELYKTKNTMRQSNLNKLEREINIQGAYALKNEERIKNKKVLIIDDIYTTGATANECSRVLKNAETQKIGILTIAKD